MMRRSQATRRRLLLERYMKLAVSHASAVMFGPKEMRESNTTAMMHAAAAHQRLRDRKLDRKAGP